MENRLLPCKEKSLQLGKAEHGKQVKIKGNKRFVLDQDEGMFAWAEMLVQPV